MDARQVPADGAWGLGFGGCDGTPELGLVFGGDERVVAGLNQEDGAGNFGNDVYGSDGVEVGLGDPLCQTIGGVLEHWAGGAEVGSMARCGVVKI